MRPFTSGCVAFVPVLNIHPVLSYILVGFQCLSCVGPSHRQKLGFCLAPGVSDQGNSAPTSKVAPEPSLLLPMEAVARRVASGSPHANDVVEGTPVVGTLTQKSKKSALNEIAVGTPVQSRVSRQQAVKMLVESMEKATAPELSLEEILGYIYIYCI